MILNIMIIVVSSILGSAMVTGIDSKIVAPICLLIAITAALINFFRFPEIAERHRAACVKFSIIRINVDIALATFESTGEIDNDLLNQIERLWNNAHEESPYVQLPTK